MKILFQKHISMEDRFFFSNHQNGRQFAIMVVRQHGVNVGSGESRIRRWCTAWNVAAPWWCKQVKFGGCRCSSLSSSLTNGSCDNTSGGRHSELNVGVRASTPTGGRGAEADWVDEGR